MAKTILFRPRLAAGALASLSGVLLLGCSSDSSVTPVEGGLDAAAPRDGSGGSRPTLPAPEAGRDASRGVLPDAPSKGHADAAPNGTPNGAPDGGDAAADGDIEAAVGAERGYAWQVFYDRSFAAHVEVDSQGAAIVSGTFFDAKNIHLGAETLVSHGAADVMLSRVLRSGTVDWARGYGSTAEDYPVSFVLDPSDRIDLVGLYNGTGNIGGPDFPAFAGTPMRYDVYVAGLTATGDHRWSHTITSTEEAFAGPGLALDDSGNLLVPGSFLGSATVAGVTHGSTGSWDALFARYDEPNGNVTADLPFGGSGDDRASQAVFTGKEVLVVGRFQGSVTFPTATPKTLVSAGGTDIFLARLTPAGVMLDVTAFGGPGDEDVARARLDASGNLLIGGTFSSATLAVFGGAPLATAGGKDLFVAALSPSLAHAWSVRFGGEGDDYLRDLAVGSAGTVAITGEFSDSITFGRDTWNASRADDAAPRQIDFFVATLGEKGAPSWSHAAGGPAPDRGLGVAVDAGGDLYVTASFQSPIDFGGGEVLTPDPGEWASALVRYAVR